MLLADSVLSSDRPSMVLKGNGKVKKRMLAGICRGILRGLVEGSTPPLFLSNNSNVSNHVIT